MSGACSKIGSTNPLPTVLVAAAWPGRCPHVQHMVCGRQAGSTPCSAGMSATKALAHVFKLHVVYDQPHPPAPGCRAAWPVHACSPVHHMLCSRLHSLACTGRMHGVSSTHMQAQTLRNAVQHGQANIYILAAWAEVTSTASSLLTDDTLGSSCKHCTSPRLTCLARDLWSAAQPCHCAPAPHAHRQHWLPAAVCAPARPCTAAQLLLWHRTWNHPRRAPPSLPGSPAWAPAAFCLPTLDSINNET